ncbi:MAG: response regulator [Candidatus Nitrosotenuis sp.]
MKSVLVVDDNKDIRGLFKTILESSGYQCTTANDGKEGLDMLRANKFDLVLLDLAMPNMSGIDVLKKVKDDASLAKNKILIITASSPADSEIDSIKKNFKVLDVVKKPINKAKLVQLIQNFS